jgi:hypothetical protein
MHSKPRNSMSRVLIIFCLWSAVFEVGCISTRVTSLVDPAYRDSSYGRILVIGNYEKLELTKLAEQHLVEDLKDSGVFAIAQSDLLPPLRKYSDSEITAIYVKYNLDACIIISMTGQTSNDYYMPGWTNIGNSIHQGYTGTSVTTSVNQMPGHYQTKSVTDSRAELRDIKSGALVCRCETSSEQTRNSNDILSSGSNNDYLMSSICKKIVEELRKNNLIKTK